MLARGLTDPMVLAATGYSLSTRRSELTRVYAANQLTYEFRYFPPSRPTGPIDWSTNTVRQGAEDAHRLVQAFKPIFTASWVGTGISKGGMTSVYHRRFYPNDVDATVAMVTPVNDSRVDPRSIPFLRSVGGATWATCRQALLDFQRRSLMMTAAIQPLMPGNYTRLGKPIALEHAVIEAGFSFWQYTLPADPSFGCSRIPLATATAQQHADFIDTHAGWSNFTDPVIATYDSFYVSSALELGGPAPDDALLAPLVTQPGTYTYDDARYMPAGFTGTYDAGTQNDVTQWVATQSERMMFIYGEFDPWSAGQYAPNASRDNLVLTVPGGNHNVRIADLPLTTQSLAWNTLDRWLNATGVPTRASFWLGPPPEDVEEIPEARRRQRR